MSGGWLTRGSKYVPLDEVLAVPRVRILRALLRFGWAEGIDVFEALGDVLQDARTNNNYSVVLSRLVREHAVKRREIVRGRAGGRYEYAVTLLGRVQLAMAMRRTQPEVELGPLTTDAEVA